MDVAAEAVGAVPLSPCPHPALFAALFAASTQSLAEGQPLWVGLETERLRLFWVCTSSWHIQFVGAPVALGRNLPKSVLFCSFLPCSPLPMPMSSPGFPGSTFQTSHLLKSQSQALLSGKSFAAQLKHSTTNLISGPGALLLPLPTRPDRFIAVGSALDENQGSTLMRIFAEGKKVPI